MKIKYFKYFIVTLTAFLLQSSLIACISGLEQGTIAEDRKSIEIEQQLIEAIRQRYESQILAITGVVFVSNGINRNGKPCLKIGTSVPEEDIRSVLPNELFIVEVEFNDVGEMWP